jgi:hypothetical protein
MYDKSTSGTPSAVFTNEEKAESRAVAVEAVVQQKEQTKENLRYC